MIQPQQTMSESWHNMAQPHPETPNLQLPTSEALFLAVAVVPIASAGHAGHLRRNPGSWQKPPKSLRPINLKSQFE